MSEQQDQREQAGGPWWRGVRPRNGAIVSVSAAVVLTLGVAAALDVVGGGKGGKGTDKGKAKDGKPSAQVAVQTDTGGPPKYVVGIPKPGTSVTVREVSSGKEVGISVGPPPGRTFQQVARRADGAFVLADYGAGTISFSRLQLDPDGRPHNLAPLPAVEVRGVSTSASDMAVTPDSKRIAYVTYAGSTAQIQVVSTAQGSKAHQWRSLGAGTIGQLSWSGTTLSFVWTPGQGGSQKRQLRSLDTTSTAADLRASKLVRALPEGGAVDQPPPRVPGLKTADFVDLAW